MTQGRHRIETHREPNIQGSLIVAKQTEYREDATFVSSITRAMLYTKGIRFEPLGIFEVTRRRTLCESNIDRMFGRCYFDVVENTLYRTRTTRYFRAFVYSESRMTRSHLESRRSIGSSVSLSQGHTKTQVRESDVGSNSTTPFRSLPG